MAAPRNGPVPAKLVLLSDLQSFCPGEKVRFLGCVTDFSTRRALLTMEHNHPSGNKIKASVDIKLSLDTLEPSVTQIGEWVNVIGYVDARDAHTQVDNTVPIQAILLWTSGPFKLDVYEGNLDRLNADLITTSKPG